MNSKVSAKFILTNPVHFFSFGFGSGLAPKAPGTFGTLAAIPVYLLLVQVDLWLYALCCVIALFLGIYLCNKTATALKVHDHPGIVWDEIVGFLITMSGFALNWQNILAGFILFRFFDIVKPWPIKWIDQKVSGGLGIMLDDVIAGVFAWCCLYAIVFFTG